MKRQRVKIGDVLLIPLPTGEYAYGRLFRDACIAIYREISKHPNHTPKDENYHFTVGVYQDVIKSGQWPIIDHRPFINNENAWPPPMCVIDETSGNYSIYHKGQLSKSSKEFCHQLEEAAVWDANHIIDRIMGKDIWHKR